MNSSESLLAVLSVFDDPEACGFSYQESPQSVLDLLDLSLTEDALGKGISRELREQRENRNLPFLPGDPAFGEDTHDRLVENWITRSAR